MEEYLKSSDVIDWEHPAVFSLAKQLSSGVDDSLEVAKICFEWVRDEIRHSHDYQMNPVTCSASEVVAAGTGYCYAKSHLLAALLRANSIPAGLCYQRLSRDGNGEPYSLHGLNAILVPRLPPGNGPTSGWYRVDPRGNRQGVNAQFTPPVEQLAFTVLHTGEADLPGVWAEPLPVVINALRSCQTYEELWEKPPDYI